jgi:hypothetical protein
MDMGVVVTLLMIGMMVLIVGAIIWSVLSVRVRRAGGQQAWRARLPSRRV